MTDDASPCWLYGPDGEARVFDDASEAPSGWADHPSKVKAAKDPFDHDGDGEPGGSKPKSARRKVNRRGASK